MRNSTAGVPFILICVLLDILGIGLIIPVLPQLIGSLSNSQASQAWWLGAMLVGYGIMQFLFAPTLGALSDRYGRRPILLLGIFGLTLMFFVPALSNSLELIFFSRVVGGMCAGNIAVAQAYLADVTTKEQRAVAFGKLGACFGIGFILGPAIGGILGENDFRIPFFFAGTLSLLNFAYGLFILPESLKAESRHLITFTKLNPLSSLYQLGQFKFIGLLLGVLALTSFAQSMLHSTWTLFTNFRFGWTPLNIGLSLVVIGVVNVIVQGFLLKKLLRIFGKKTLVLAGIASSSVVYLAIALVEYGPLVYLFLFLNFLSFAVPPTLNSMISEAVPAEDQGRAMGTVSALNSLMGVLAPLLGTPLLVHTSAQPSNSILAGMPYFFCSLILFIAFLLAVRDFSKR